MRADRARWLAEMCEEVGVAAPRDAEGMALDASTWVSERVRAEIPGNGPHDCEAILAHSGTDAAAAVVVDDGPEQRRWATALGIAAYPSLGDLLAALA